MTRATPRLRHNDGNRYPVEVTGPSEAEKAARKRKWKTALQLAGGDARRLRVEANGSITILSEPRRIFLASEPVGLGASLAMFLCSITGV